VSEKDINKIFALLYEIKKRLAKLEKNMSEDDKQHQINTEDKYTGDFTRGSSLW
jgi:hypothetical protein